MTSLFRGLMSVKGGLQMAGYYNTVLFFSSYFDTEHDFVTKFPAAEHLCTCACHVTLCSEKGWFIRCDDLVYLLDKAAAWSSVRSVAVILSFLSRAFQQRHVTCYSYVHWR